MMDCCVRLESGSRSSVRSARAVVGDRDLDALGQPGPSRRASLDGGDGDDSVSAPWRTTTMPPTVSPSPFQSASPRRISGPMHVATSWSRSSGEPASAPTPSAMLANVVERLDVAEAAHHELAFSATSSSRPPASLLLRADGVADLRDRDVVGAQLVGVHLIWYCLTKPPMEATSATPGTDISSYLRNQSWMERSSLRSSGPS
jgi:hypothetical protein